MDSILQRLPILVNQWANVVRWEMCTRLFLKQLNSFGKKDILLTQQERGNSRNEQMINVYATFAEKFMAMPLYKIKSANERFAGALKHTVLKHL